MPLLHSYLCSHVTSSEPASWAILPQTYIHFFIYFLFSYIALLFFTAHITTWHYVFSYWLITDLLHLNVNSKGKDLELVTAYCWCLQSAHGRSSVISFNEREYSGNHLSKKTAMITSVLAQNKHLRRAVCWNGKETGLRKQEPNTILGCMSHVILGK